MNIEKTIKQLIDKYGIPKVLQVISDDATSRGEKSHYTNRGSWYEIADQIERILSIIAR